MKSHIYCFYSEQATSCLFIFNFIVQKLCRQITWCQPSPKVHFQMVFGCSSQDCFHSQLRVYHSTSCRTQYDPPPVISTPYRIQARH